MTALTTLVADLLVRAATGGHRLSGPLKSRVLNLFLILVNLRENLDRGGKPGKPVGSSR